MVARTILRPARADPLVGLPPLSTSDHIRPPAQRSSRSAPPGRRWGAPVFRSFVRARQGKAWINPSSEHGQSISFPECHGFAPATWAALKRAQPNPLRTRTTVPLALGQTSVQRGPQEAQPRNKGGMGGRDPQRASGQAVESQLRPCRGSGRFNLRPKPFFDPSFAKGRRPAIKFPSQTSG